MDPLPPPPGFPPPPPPPPPVPPAGTGRSGPAWESTAPFVQRYLDTAKAVALDPNGFFSNMRMQGGFTDPLVYALIGTAGAGLVGSILAAILPFVSAAFFVSIIVVPCMVAVGLFIGAGIYHLVLNLLGGVKQPYEATFRVAAYAVGTTMWANVVPFCGGIAGSIWALVCMVIGLQRTHDVSTGMAVAAVLIPAAVCGLAALVITMLGVGAAIIGGAMAGIFQ